MHSSIGERLKEERERLNLSQMAFGDIGGVKKLAQLRYEKGERMPDASYLCAISKIGADVQFIITGVRSIATLTTDEEELLDRYRQAVFAVKRAVFAALSADNPDSESKTINVSGGSGQRIAGRDFNEYKK